MTAPMELPRRNGLAVEQALRRMEEKLHEMAARVDSQNAAIAGLIGRLVVLEQADAMRRVAGMGHGPTVA